MRRLIWLICAALLAAACASQKPWSRPGKSREEAQRDVLQCRQYGMQSAQAQGLAGNMFVELWINDEAAKCLRSLGYEQR